MCKAAIQTLLYSEDQPTGHMEDTRKSCHNYVDGYNSHWEMMRRANVGTLFRRPLTEHMCMYMHIMMQLAKWQHT